MKYSVALSGLLMVVGVGFSSGCSQPEEPGAAPQASTEQSRADSGRAAQNSTATAEKVDPQLQAQIDSLRTATEKATNGAGAASASAPSKTQLIMDSAKRLISENNGAEALKMLNGLSRETLTPREQVVLDTLKQQAQRLAHQAASAAANDQASKTLEELLPPK
jgi:hypothetical protein